MLFLTYGVMFGGGSSLAYTPSLVILGHYFKRHMGLVNGFVTSGSSIFTMVMPHIMRGIIDAYEEDGVIRRCLHSNFAVENVTTRWR